VKPASRRDYVFFFGPDSRSVESDLDLRPLLGSKGAGLTEMSRSGIPTPPGFTISTEACAYYSKNQGAFPAGLMTQVKEKLAKIEHAAGGKFGDPRDPLLVSVRSGQALPVPGVMDAILNLGLSDSSVQGFIQRTVSERAGWDCYRRFISMFGRVVMGPSTGLTGHDFEVESDRLKRKYGAREESDLTASQLKELVEIYKRIYHQKVRKPFPQDPAVQLEMAIRAVFDSWNSERAGKYRLINKVTGMLGTAVNVCAMVYGNLDDESGAGVAFSRDGITGRNRPAGEFLVNAQGEELTAGLRPAKPLEVMLEHPGSAWPKVWEQLRDELRRLERHFRHPQEVEFTVQRGKLWILQTRPAKRTGVAGVRWAVEMATGRDVQTGEEQPRILSPREALQSLHGGDLDQLLHPIFEAAALREAEIVAGGLSAGSGIATGQIVFFADQAEARVREDPQASVILVRHECSPEDMAGVWAAKGLLTTAGGVNSPAAIMARGWGKCCICGASSMQIDYRRGILSVGRRTFKEGDWLSLDGSTGTVYQGRIPTEPSPVVSALVDGKRSALNHPVFGLYKQVSDWADAARRIGVRANADTAEEAAMARALGAEGIGLCRTERLFLGDGSLEVVHEFLLAKDAKGRDKALARLLTPHRKEFEGLLAAMGGGPVAIRLLDAPLRDLLPTEKREQAELARRLGLTVDGIARRVKEGKEEVPLMGRRGCRLLVTYPEIPVLQTRAIIEAACNLEKKKLRVVPEIVVPMASSKAELDFVERLVRQTADRVLKDRKSRLKYRVGATIQLPRAALTADELAETAEFFSLDTRELTQMTLGMSHDDCGGYLPDYLTRRLLPADPFQQLDATGVGQLVEIAVRKGRSTRPGLPCGTCGDHGGDPASVRFFHRAGLNYLSCAALRVPVVRLAAAQASLSR